MRRSEIAAKVFEVLDAVPLTDVQGGPLAVPVADIGGLAMVPWYCEVSVQWAIRITQPGVVLKKSLVKKTNDSFISATEEGALLIGVPGDGINPSIYTLFPLAMALTGVVKPGMVLELAAANLGMVKRDWEIPAETSGIHGNHRYVGTVDADGNWLIAQSAPAVSRDALSVAIDSGRIVMNDGPWAVKDKDEARAVLTHWLNSPQANVNPLPVKFAIRLQDGAFVNSNPNMTSKLYGLGLGIFRVRLANGPYQWEDSQPYPYPSPAEIEDVLRAVIG